jgi:hypothetical protein
LCVDEVYQGELALLLTVDPAAPDGDRLVGYTLLANTKAVDQEAVKAFLKRLRSAGIQPDEVSNLSSTVGETRPSRRWAVTWANWPPRAVTIPARTCAAGPSPTTVQRAGTRGKN